MNRDQSPWRDPVVRVFFFLMMAFIAVCLLAVRAVDPAHAHEATNAQGQPQGWQYDAWCCNDQDCRPALKGEVEAIQSGYAVRSLGVTVPYGSKAIRPSPDGQYHLCVLPGATAPRCLYTPDMGS